LIYRPEIDGLRAIAVVPVILFHAGVPAFSGGYVGVDVFFVISGYLITSIILPELEQDRFSLARFYDRRARRILPALFTVILVCVPFAWAWMLPDDLKEFAQSLMAVPLFVSNIWFRMTTGYFATTIELKPLVHTWSLAVEEQYYLLFPVFLILAWRSGRKWLLVMLGAVALLSLAVSQWEAINRPMAAYYLLPARGWELLLGVFLAFHQFMRKEAGPASAAWGRCGSELLTLAGIGAIVYSIIAFSKSTVFPGIHALLPTVGAGCLIAFATQETWTGRLLGSRPLVGIGLISYSAYLWHQPLFALARVRGIAVPPLWIFLMLSAAAFFLAYASWRFVEQPFRDKRRVSRKSVFLLASCMSVGVVGLGYAGYRTNGFESRFSLPATMIDSFNRTTRTEECFYKPAMDSRPDWLCSLGATGPAPTFVLFGDSHSLSMLPAFEEAARHLGQSGIYTGATGCTPLLGIFALRTDQTSGDCHALNRRVFEFVRTHGIKKVYLVARWTYYTDGGYDGTDFSYIALAKNAVRDRSASRVAFASGLAETVRAYAGIGVRLYVLAQVPEQRYNAKTVYYKTYGDDAVRFRQSLRTWSVSLEDHLRLQGYVRALFDQYSTTRQLRVIKLDDLFCAGDRCLMGDVNRSYYFDEDHLSVTGAQKTVDVIKGTLQE
jgi:peptidoglycan/LPS O-acetylase OafA/YrhL